MTEDIKETVEDALRRTAKANIELRKTITSLNDNAERNENELVELTFKVNKYYTVITALVEALEEH